MVPVRKKRLIYICCIVLGIALAVAIMLLALQQNINFFYSPSQVAAGESPTQQYFRLGGMVKKGSVVREPDSLKVRFVLTDHMEDINISYDGILPDLFREQQGIVVQGQLDPQGNFIASEVLAKHDENYMPKEVREALAQAELAKQEANLDLNKESIGS